MEFFYRYLIIVYGLKKNISIKLKVNLMGNLLTISRLLNEMNMNYTNLCNTLPQSITLVVIVVSHGIQTTLHVHRFVHGMHFQVYFINLQLLCFFFLHACMIMQQYVNE